MQNFGGQTRCIMEMYRNGELIMLQDKKNLVCVPSPNPVGLVPVLMSALGMALVRVPINAALMAVDVFAPNHWVCTLTINIPALKLGVARLLYACSSCLLTLNLSLLCIMGVTTVQNWQVCSCLK